MGAVHNADPDSNPKLIYAFSLTSRTTAPTLTRMSDDADSAKALDRLSELARKAAKLAAEQVAKSREAARQVNKVARKLRATTSKRPKPRKR